MLIFNKLFSCFFPFAGRENAITRADLVVHTIKEEILTIEKSSDLNVLDSMSRKELFSISSIFINFDIELSDLQRIQDKKELGLQLNNLITPPSTLLDYMKRYELADNYIIVR